ncbi:DUF3024 domain-containing protein [Pseudoalteromonas sp. S979]|uniref:DUF3024 domain-containing protein n=1 Tax=Pseudoalteromonas sp. S979 TaxID=579570 RepID=UPI0032D5A83D
MQRLSPLKVNGKLSGIRQDVQWHGYEPNMYVKTIEQGFAVIDHDEYACFFG